MKALKITLLLLAVVLLAMSGVSMDQVESQESIKTPEKFELNLITHDRVLAKLPGNS